MFGVAREVRSNQTADMERDSTDPTLRETAGKVK